MAAIFIGANRRTQQKKKGGQAAALSLLGL